MTQAPQTSLLDAICVPITAAMPSGTGPDAHMLTMARDAIVDIVLEAPRHISAVVAVEEARA